MIPIDFDYRLLDRPAIVEDYRPQRGLEMLVQNQLGNEEVCENFDNKNLFEEMRKEIDGSRTVSIFGHDKDFGLVQFIIKLNQNDEIVAGFIYHTKKENKIQLYSLTYFKEKGNDVVLYYSHDFNGNWIDYNKIETSCIDKRGYSRRVWEDIYKNAKELEKREKEMKKGPQKNEKDIERKQPIRDRGPKVTV